MLLYINVCSHRSGLLTTTWTPERGKQLLLVNTHLHKSLHRGVRTAGVVCDREVGPFHANLLNSS